MTTTTTTTKEPSPTVSIRGIDCFVHHWKPKPTTTTTPTPRALVVIFHGFLAHGNYPTVRYAAEFLVEENYAVVAVDLPGHGQSGGMRGYLESAETVISDGAAIVDYAKGLYNNDDQLPLFLVGSSMGGAIALSVAQKLGTTTNNDAVQVPVPVAGVVLLAPMLKLNVSSMERSLLQGLSFFLGSVPLIPSSATDDSKQYRDETKRKECQEDTLTVSGSSLRVSSALACVDLTVQIQTQFESMIDCPYLLMIADEDVVVKNEGSEELFAKSVLSKDKTKKHYAALHGLLCEPSPLFDEIKQDMLSWMAERT
jgi:alpha-beta hydrolase superfamily lysophospholipase